MDSELWMQNTGFKIPDSITTRLLVHGK